MSKPQSDPNPDPLYDSFEKLIQSLNTEISAKVVLECFNYKIHKLPRFKEIE